MKERNALFIAHIAVWIIGLTGCARPDREPPNLLFVFADQYRKQAAGYMKEDPVMTPHLDQLAREGLAFTNAVSSCPVCSPFRAMLMTGRFPMTTGITSNCLPGTDLQLDEAEICIGDVLKRDGYATGYIGKWHLEIPSLNRSANPEDGASDPWDGWTPPGSRRHGFDYWYAYNCNAKHFHPNYWSDSPRRIDVDQWSAEHETDKAIEFIKKRKPGTPFALFMSWNPPHNPYIAPQNYLELYESKDLKVRPNAVSDRQHMKRYRSYLAAVTSCDDQLGRLLACLEEEGLTDNTIVIFTSDHGEMMGSHDRYAKSIWYEESSGIPFVIKWPGRIREGIEPMPFACYHFMPTILGLLGLEIPGTVEGTDYSRLIRGESERRAGSAVIASYGNPANLLANGQEPSVWAKQADSLHRLGIDWRTVGYRALKTERYTYVVNRGRQGSFLEKYLYDNQADPYQLDPDTLAGDQANDTLQYLETELKEWLVRMHDPFSIDKAK